MNPIAKLLSGPSLARSVLEHSSQPVIVASGAGAILFANQPVQDWFGYAGSEITGLTLNQLFRTTQHRAPDAHRVPKMSHDDETGLVGGPQRVVCKDGSEVPVNVTLVAVEEQSQLLILVNFSKTDSASNNGKVLESERLDAVAKMISGLAHESRNALQRAVACLDLMELDLMDDNRHMELTAKIRQSLSDLLNNYNEVKRFAQPISLQRSRQRVLPLCREAICEMQDQPRLSGSEFSFPDDRKGDDFAHVDGDRLKEVFRHVIENALDHSLCKVTIGVKCESADVDGHAAMRIMIYDNGQPFSKEALVRAFEPFYTTKQHGTGLGLSICRRIVQAHGGTIKVTNPDQGGALVEIDLPKTMNDSI